MSKDRLKNLIELVPEEKPLQDEIEAIPKANKSIQENGTVSHNAIDWN